MLKVFFTSVSVLEGGRGAGGGGGGGRMIRMVGRVTESNVAGNA